ncbi:hypothetical protein BSKO_08923 [Bryopsis sp. KO-2023]|nr:hypothetical protein BSKO_08923 [Bryopsis sp. KO-2023]
MAKGKSTDSSVQRFLKKQVRKAKVALGELAARSWEVSECATVLEDLVANVNNEELEKKIKMDFDRWVNVLHKLLNGSNPSQPEISSAEPPAKKLKTGIATKTSEGQVNILSSTSLDDFCQGLFGVDMDGLDSRICGMPLKDCVELAKKGVQLTAGASMILSCPSSLQFFSPVLRCLQSVAKRISKDDKTGMLAAFCSIFNRLKATIATRAHMSVESLSTQGKLSSDPGGPSDGQIICEVLLLDLELSWANLVSRSGAASKLTSIKFMTKGKDQCTHNIRVFGGRYLLQILEFLLKDGLAFSFDQWRFKEGEAWFAIFSGVWDFSRGLDERDLLYVHRIAVARKAEVTYPDMYSEFYSGSQIGFRETPLAEIGQIGAPPEFGAWINSISGRMDLMAAWSKGPQSVTKTLMRKYPLALVVSISNAWTEKEGVPDNPVEMASEGQQLFFMDTEGSKAVWESTERRPESVQTDSDVESLDLDELPGGGESVENEASKSKIGSDSELSEILSSDEQEK